MEHQRAFIYANFILNREDKVKFRGFSSLGHTIISTRWEQRISARYCTSDHNNSIELTIYMTITAVEVCPHIYLQIKIHHIPCIHQIILDPHVLPSSWLLRYPLTLTSRIRRFHLLYYCCYKPNLFWKVGSGEWSNVYSNKMGEQQFQIWCV